jgi:hypothetical protein
MRSRFDRPEPEGRLPTALLALLACLVVPAGARGVEVPFGAGVPASDEVVGAAAIAAADLDGDGDLDLVTAGAAGVDLLRNLSGDGAAWSRVPLAATAATSVAAADLDRDGDLDLVAGGAAGLARLDNTAGDATSFGASPIGAASGVTGLAVGDLDGDGDLDVVTSASGGAVELHRNTGSGASFATSPIASDAGGSAGVALGDLDGDGDLDVASAAAALGSVRWHRNLDGAAASWSSATVATSLPGVAAVALGDLDGDGDLDVASATTGDASLRVHLDTTGDAASFATQVVSATEPGVAARARGDVDADGDLDVASGAAGSGAVRWHENTAGDTSAFAARPIGTAASGNAVAVTVADGDGDGDLDVAYASSGDATVGFFPQLRSHRSASFRPQPPLGTTGGIENLEAADLDGDGDLDVAFTQGDLIAPLVGWYENDGAGAFAQRSVDTTLLGAEPLAAADLDADGDLDLAVTSQLQSTLRWYENAGGSPPVFTPRTIDAAAAGIWAVVPADLDRDGDLDLVTSRQNGVVGYYANDGASPPAWSTPTTLLDFGPAGGRRILDIADLDADGDPDLLSSTLLDDTVAWAENPGSLPWIAHPLSTTANGTRSLDAADLDRDGDLDVLTDAFFDDQLLWFENDGAADPSFAQRTLAPGLDGAKDPRAADLDGDGDLDVIATAREAGTVVWLESDGAADPAFAVRPVASVVKASAVVTGDFDADGDPDAFATSGLSGPVVYAPNEGGQFALATQDLAPATLEEGLEAPILSIDVGHRGRAGDPLLELSTVALRLLDAVGAPLTPADAAQAIGAIALFRDEGSGSFGPGDALVASAAAPFGFTAGELPLALLPGDPFARVDAAATGRFFVVLEMGAEAFGLGPGAVRLAHATESTSQARDATSGLPLSLESVPDALSGVVTATPGDADGDGLAGDVDNCPAVANPGQQDADADGRGDVCDNCTLAANGPLVPDAGGQVQLDTDGDGYGNRCDADFDQSGLVNTLDLAAFKARFFTADPDANLDGAGIVNTLDLAIFRSHFFRPPGPSGLH